MGDGGPMDTLSSWLNTTGRAIVVGHMEEFDHRGEVRYHRIMYGESALSLHTLRTAPDAEYTYNITVSDGATVTYDSRECRRQWEYYLRGPLPAFPAAVVPADPSPSSEVLERLGRIEAAIDALAGRLAPAPAPPSAAPPAAGPSAPTAGPSAPAAGPPAPTEGPPAPAAGAHPAETPRRRAKFGEEDVTAVGAAELGKAVAFLGDNATGEQLLRCAAVMIFGNALRPSEITVTKPAKDSSVILTYDGKAWVRTDPADVYDRIVMAAAALLLTLNGGENLARKVISANTSELDPILERNAFVVAEDDRRG